MTQEVGKTKSGQGVTDQPCSLRQELVVSGVFCFLFHFFNCYYYLAAP